jgi:4-amino-4-deoxychorismate lyase
MYPFLETIKIDQGEVKSLHFHQQRMDMTLQALRNAGNPFRLKDKILCPEEWTGKIVKCRVLYDLDGIAITYDPYHKRSLKSFKLIDGKQISYSYKYADRLAIDQLFASRGVCDDIIIAKNGLVTDTSMANLVFRKNRWLYTPASPLLGGTKRKQYIEEGRIRPKEVHVSELKDYDAFKCINAMLDLEDSDWLPISCIQ